MKIGDRVRLVGQGPTVYTVSAVEAHNGLVFYRVAELVGALFLGTSLELV